MKTRIAVAVLTLAAAFACGRDTPSGVPTPPPAPPPPPGQPPPPPPGPGAGTLTATLTTPSSDDAAILVELRGPSIHGVALSGSAWTMFVDSSSTPIRVMVAGRLATGVLLTFQVPDVNAVASYSATIVDVANTQNQLREKTGYSLVVAR